MKRQQVKKMEIKEPREYRVVLFYSVRTTHDCYAYWDGKDWNPNKKKAMNYRTWSHAMYRHSHHHNSYTGFIEQEFSWKRDWDIQTAIWCKCFMSDAVYWEWYDMCVAPVWQVPEHAVYHSLMDTKGDTRHEGQVTHTV